MKSNSYGGDVGAVKEERKGQLLVQIIQLEETCQHIGALVEQLENTLEPVLRVRSESSKAGKDVPQQALVVRANQVHSLDDQFRGMLAQLADILDRLEV